MIESPKLNLRTPLATPTLKGHGLIYSTWQLIQGRLWPLIEEALSLGNHQYRASSSFSVVVLGKIVVSTNDEQDTVVLKHARNGEIKNSSCNEKISGGYGWDTFARICFGWENLIMAEGEQHSKLIKTLGPLFNVRSVRENYYKDLKAVTQASVKSWAEEKQEINLLNFALVHSCKSVTTCFLGQEAAKSNEIIDAVQNLMGIFWDNAQIKIWALICQVWRKIFGRFGGDSQGYWHSHDILDKAIEEARKSAPEGSFIARLEADKFTHQELIDNMKMLYFAGSETTGSLITTINGHLAANQEEQKKLFEELKSANVNSLEDLDYETLHMLSRLQAVFYESLRLVPPIPIQVRKVESDYGSYNYFTDHYHRLRDSNLVGEDPNQFNPDRILNNPDLIKEVQKTFGRGLSPCIGKHFAMTETLLLVAAMILQGPFELTSGDPSEVIMEAGAHLSKDLKIKFT